MPGFTDPVLSCESCGQGYVLVKGYNDEQLCFWCRRGIVLTPSQRLRRGPAEPPPRGGSRSE